MMWKGSLPIVSVLLTAVVVLPTIVEGQLEKNSWKCHPCQPGTFVAQKCALLYGTRCSPCPAGTFTDHYNKLYQCIRCSTCLEGQVEQVTCNREHDTLCVTDPMMRDGSGEVSQEKESKFSNIFTDKNGAKVKYSDIPQLSNVEKTEEGQEELSGDTPINPNLFNMDSLEPQQAKTDKPVQEPTEEATTTVSALDDVTTAHLPDKEAEKDDLIPIQEAKSEAQQTTTPVIADIEGSGTLGIAEVPEITTKTLSKPVVVVTDSPQTTPEPEPEIETVPSTTLLVQVPEVVTKSAYPTFNEIGEPVDPSSEKVLAETTEAAPALPSVTTTVAAPVEEEVMTTLATAAADDDTKIVSTIKEPLTDTETDSVESESESEEKTESEIVSDEITETVHPVIVTDVPTTFSSVPVIETSTAAAEPVITTVLLKKIIAPMGTTIDEDEAMRNKTPIAETIPLLSTTTRTAVDQDETSAEQQTSTLKADEETTIRDTDAIIPSAFTTELTTTEHIHPINGSELLQEPAVDSAATSDDNKHLDVAIAAVITGIGLVVLVVIGVRYCMKKRTFKDMRVSTGGCLAQSWSTLANQGSRLVAATKGRGASATAGTATYRPTPETTNSAWP